MESHDESSDSPGAKKIKKIADDPDKLLVVIDPRVSETAKIADIHLALRPGTDALLFKAMIAIILYTRCQYKHLRKFSVKITEYY